MELAYIQDKVKEEKINELKSAIISAKPPNAYPDAMKEYNPETHQVVIDNFGRPDKVINIGTEDEPNKTDTVYVARIPIPFQQKIVRMRATFLCGNPVELMAKTKDDLEEQYLSVIKKTWDDNKLDYKNKQILKIQMSEMEVAELWYPDETDPDYWVGTPNEGKTKIRFKCKILAESKGDKLYPVWDELGDLVAFAREYVTVTENDKKIYHFDIYTAESIYYATQKMGMYTVDKKEVNMFGKGQVMYGQQPLPEWAPVKRPIHFYESAISDHTDANGYNLDGQTVVEGKVISYSKKGQKGGVIEIEPGAKISTLEFKQAVESRELEQKNLRKHIMDDTSTPDISFEQMQGLGQFSGIALKMLFLDAHMAAADKEEIFGEYIQRRINFLKVAHAKINPAFKKCLTLKITPKFDYYLPKDEAGRIDLLRSANGGKPIMSQQSAIQQNPLIEDSAAEQLQIDKEAQAEAQANNAP